MQWETIIGLEIHIQLNTLTKAFCSDSAKFSNDPNTQTSIVSLAHPGTLPKLNVKQIESAIKLGLAMHCQINHSSYFERKQYFYPDLPKGYQISQQASPICIGGHIDLTTSEGIKSIRLHHIHMEEDAGKSIHDTDPTWSKIDLNRAGVPLLEMVTEPDFRSAEEVTVFLSDLQRLVRYLDISDANMEEGSMRCDINVSVRPLGTSELRERCEVKNVNSRRFARRALEFEANRQIKIWESGGEVRRNTMQFVPEEGVTIPIRSKESAHDYRYFPDPDLPPIKVTQAQIDAIKYSSPMLPQAYLDILIKEKNLSRADAIILIDDQSTVHYYLELVKDHPELNKFASNWMIQTLLPYLKDHHQTIHNFIIPSTSIIQLLTALSRETITNSQAQEIWKDILSNPTGPIEQFIQNKVSASPSYDISHIVEEIFTTFPIEAAEYKGGKKKLLGFFLGEIKKRYPGVNVKAVQEKMG